MWFGVLDKPITSAENNSKKKKNYCGLWLHHISSLGGDATFWWANLLLF
jgi:hypothetical protein